MRQLAAWLPAVGAHALATAGLLVAALVAWFAASLLTSDGRAVAAAGQALQRHQGSAENDVFVVSGAIGRDERDRGRILFPFRPHAAIASDATKADLKTFPFSRAVLVGEVDSLDWGLARGGLEPSGAVRIPLGNPDHLLLAMVDYTQVAVKTEQGEQPCTRRHASGGVACGAADWFYVGPTSDRIDGTAKMCLWVHPPPSGALIVPFILPAVRSVEDGPLIVVLNFLDQVRQEPARPQVSLRLELDGREPQVTACHNQEGRCSLQIWPKESKQGRLTVETSNNARQLVCLTGGLAARIGATW